MRLGNVAWSARFAMNLTHSRFFDTHRRQVNLRRSETLFDLDQAPAPKPVLTYTPLPPERRTIAKDPDLFLERNPHLAGFCSIGERQRPVDAPYAESIAAGKNTYVYDAHTYHTKVPPQGIKQLIAYYTTQEDTVLDPFCGSGMTGVAATELGRRVILSDLSPAAAFIAYNHATPVSATKFLAAVRHLVEQSSTLERYLYETRVRETSARVPMLYTVWSFGLLCSACHAEFLLWDVARDERPSVRESKIRSEFRCPSCGASLNKRGLKRTRRYPVQVGYPNPGGGTKESVATPDDDDLRKLAEIDTAGVPAGLWFPTTSIPQGINTRQPLAAGISRVDLCYTTRSLWAFAHLWHLALNWPDEDIRLKLLFTLTSLYKRVTVFSEFRFWGGSGNTANFNVPAIMNEQNVFRAFERKAGTISLYFGHTTRANRHVRVSCQSACDLTQIPDSSIDYIFTDPPFGGNINYSEMNLLWEAWLGTFTAVKDEAIINRYQRKGLEEYQAILTNAFREARRVLKDNSWMTVVFHNSSGEVWSALQSSILDAGLEVRGAQTFDKKHGTFKQFVSDHAVGYDLVLHCQKANTAQGRFSTSRNRVRAHAHAFIRRQLTSSRTRYSVRYLHVTRADEFDYRRLYADWLQHSIRRMEINLGFEDFRKLAEQIRTTAAST
jgi:16S rRNA G966 N2-methylase RsmD